MSVMFKPDVAAVTEALQSLQCSMIDGKTHHVLQRGDYTIYIRKLDKSEPIGTYKCAWDESKHRKPENGAHLVFRYEVSETLRSLDPELKHKR
jgi:hypothetical protein